MLSFNPSDNRYAQNLGCYAVVDFVLGIISENKFLKSKVVPEDI